MFAVGRRPNFGRFEDVFAITGEFAIFALAVVDLARVAGLCP